MDNLWNINSLMIFLLVGNLRIFLLEFCTWLQFNQLKYRRHLQTSLKQTLCILQKNFTLRPHTKWKFLIRRFMRNHHFLSRKSTFRLSILVNWIGRNDIQNYPGLMSQRRSALISSDSEKLQVYFSAVHYLKIYEQRWFSAEQSWFRA